MVGQYLDTQWQRIDPSTEKPAEWSCNILWGGNRFAKQTFRTPEMDGCLLSIPHGNEPFGGDVYHITVCNHGVLSKFLLADVMGHGKEASGLSEALLEPLARLVKELDNTVILSELNRIIREQKVFRKFATAAAATFNAWDGSFTYVYAGHPPMLIRRNGRWESLEKSDDHALPVGIINDMRFQQCAVTLQHGDFLFIYSDALTDIIMESGNEEDMIDALIGMMNRIDTDHLETFYTGLVKKLIEINGSTQFGDDLTFILLRYHLPQMTTLFSRSLDGVMRGGRKLVMRAIKSWRGLKWDRGTHCRKDN